MSDRLQPFHDAPLDAAMSDALVQQGLAVERVDNAARAENDPWLSAVARGFLEEEPGEVRREAFVGHTAHRRKLGVYDATSPQPVVMDSGRAVRTKANRTMDRVRWVTDYG